MKPLLSSLTALLLGLAFYTPAMAQTNDPTYPTPPAEPQEKVKVGVEITELGMMRALLLLDSSSLDEEKLIEQRLSDVDFRVFPAPETATGRITMDDMKAVGQEHKADLVFYATVTDRLKNKMDDFSLYEGEATVQIYSPVTGELMVTQTSRTNGERNVDEVEAERSAREKALDMASKEAITKALEKAHKILVHEAVITGVYNNRQLLAIMEYIGKMEGVYGVRQVSFDGANHIGVIDIMGSPRSETYWRAYLEKMPKAEVIVHVKVNSDLRKKYPSWFDE